MGLKSEVLKIKDILSDQYIRLDIKYRIFSDKKKFNLWNIDNIKPLSFYIQPITSNILKKGELDNEYYLIDLKSIERKTNTLIDIELVNEIGSDKVILEKGDLIIPKMEPKKGQFFLNLNHQKYLGSTELIEYKINLKITNPKFLYYVLVNTRTLQAMSYLESGKTHRRVQSFDLLKIQIPNIDLTTQNEIVQKIEPIEQEIQTLKAQKKEHLEIINKVFADEYQYSNTLWKEFGKGMTAGTQKSNNRNFITYTIPFSQIKQSNIFRFSSRFHNPITRNMENILNSKKSIKLKSILEQDIKRGVSPKYDENGEISVIKIGQLKNSCIDLTDCEFVNEDFFNLKEKSQIKTNDILIASTGKVSLGKIDINEEKEIDLMADGHISIIRISNKYSPLFLTYFLRSILGTYQIERDYTGATNQIELYANEIKNFDIPDFTLEKQLQIVEKIKSQIDAQKLIDEQIEQKQKEISDLIYRCVQNS